MATTWVEPAQGADMRDSASGSKIVVISGAGGSGKSRLLSEVRSAVLPEFPDGALPTPQSPTAHAWRRLLLGRPDLGHAAHLWRCLIIGTVVTHLAESSCLLNQRQKLRLRYLQEALPGRLFVVKMTRHPYSIVNLLFEHLAAANDTAKRQLVNHSIWDTAEEYIRSLPPEVIPPLLIEIDHLDDYFDNGPSLKMESMAGLALYLDELSKNALWPGLRIHACVRQITRHYILRQGGRDIVPDESYFEIKWTKRSVRILLQQRIGEESSSGIQDLHIAVPLRGVTEAIDEYLMRHTTLTPRSIEQIVLALLEHGSAIETSPSHYEIRKKVAEIAETLAYTTVHQFVSDLRALGGRSEASPTEEETAQDSLKEKFQADLETFTSDALSWSELQEFVERWDERTRPHLAACLWLHRLVAWAPDEGDIVRVSRTAGDRLKADYQALLIHPMLLDMANVPPVQRKLVLDYV